MWWLKKKEVEIPSLQVTLPELKVAISRNEFEKLKSYVLGVKTEISGLGLVERRKNIFYIHEIFLLEQEVSAASATIDPVAISKLMNRLIKEDRNPTDLKFWWHSHANMEAFWSGTDDSTIEKFASKDYSLSLVINKDLEYLCRMDLYQPLRVKIDRIPMEFWGTSLGTTDPKEEIAAKIREHQYVYNYAESFCPICGGFGTDCLYCKQKEKLYVD
jgi:hypothetical protein